MNINNSQEYDDPTLYDKENESYIPEIPFLQKWASKQQGLIIDIACGTGRVTIPLAKKGYNLVGVDIHKGMLTQAKKKAANLHLQIRWIEQDCTQLDLCIKSNLVYSVGNSFQHFLTNESQDGLLTSINKSLEVEGLFIFNTRFPSVEELLQPSTEEYWKSYTDNETLNIVDLFTISEYDSLKQIQHYTTIRKYKDNAGDIIKEKRTNISLRYVFPQEMERLLFAFGFEILHLYSEWNETPITNDSYEMIYVCRKIR
ncbi:class I SAM-dependent methyltransferase [Niallia circulans]|uniref:class I SAM-dependent methyltransferase n=1 Tax=Niallia circulans TaxID=1397 RepID=UPI001639F1AC|nr:class I SAM-dependent methyltransferase [Niallia circulans]